MELTGSLFWKVGQMREHLGSWAPLGFVFASRAACSSSGLPPTRVCKSVLACRCPCLIIPTAESSGLRASDREACGWDRESPGFWDGLVLMAPWMAMRSLGWCETQPCVNILRGHNYTAITDSTLVSFGLRLKKKPSPHGILRKAARSLGKIKNADVDVQDRGPRPSPPVHVTLPTAPVMCWPGLFLVPFSLL